MTADGASGPLLLECAVNLSEGRDHAVIARCTRVGGALVLDVHSDVDHHRTVVTMAGPPAELESAVRAVATEAVERIDLRTHEGAHPRLGAVDVVPFVALTATGGRLFDDDVARAVGVRDRTAAYLGTVLGVPAFCYGPLPSGAERTLPEVRRGAFGALGPDEGPARPHATAGAAAVGARRSLVAYNLFVAGGDVLLARSVAAAVRGPGVRALGLDLRGVAQVSCNLTDPFAVGPATVYDAVARRLEAAGAGVARAELVGLLPAAVLAGAPAHRWAELDLAQDRTVEARLEAAGMR